MPASILSRLIPLALSLATALIVVAQASEEEQAYPPARRESITEQIHGIQVADPYRWMESTGTDELEQWITEQNQLTKNSLGGASLQRTAKQIEALATYDLGFGGKRRSDRLFYLLRPGGGAHVELHVRSGDRSRRLMESSGIPDDEFPERYIGGRNFVASHWPDRTGDMLAYIYTDGTERARVRVLDVDSGRHLPDVIDEVSIATQLVWSATGDGFYYFRSRLIRSEGATETKRVPFGVWFHRLGTHQDADTAIIEQDPGDLHLYQPDVTEDGKHLVVMKRLGVAPASTYRVFRTDDPGAPPVSLFEHVDARFIYLGNNGSQLFFQTTHEAPNGRIVAVDLHAPDQLEEVVAETAFPMLAGSNVGGDVLGYFGGYFVVGYLKDGLADVRIVDERSGIARPLALPPGSSMWGFLDGTPGDPHFTVSLLNPFRPGHVVSVDTEDGSIRDELVTDVPVNPKDYVVERVFATSKDGTRVPMSIVYRNDIERDGSNPALIYGYGMHKWVSLLFYQPHIVHWLNIGGIYAIPAIRGGGEYGDAWHEAGIRTNRQNAVDDFVAAGRWLINNDYTSASKLAANGSSASGALAGILALRHGDVFAATTIDYPVADIVRAPFYGSGAVLTHEYGSLGESDEALAMLRQSPYHQVEQNQCLIPSLIMVGEADKVALPFHGYKLAAAMQHSQECDAPILFYEMPDTGHNYGLSAKALASNTAIQIIFLRRALDF